MVNSLRHIASMEYAIGRLSLNGYGYLCLCLSLGMGMVLPLLLPLLLLLFVLRGRISKWDMSRPRIPTRAEARPICTGCRTTVPRLPCPVI